ncbi:cytosine deaminase [Cupriavidus lacunae]|uniref:Cytosine deaminase n=2 Tax=Cupriavidus lacunae TaxID=2666307 RepID=A0A370NI92_9BURK|nr:cytosine deaminase [Cupriavidus lacunae]
MDECLGDLPVGDVLIEGDRIVAVAAHVDAPHDATVVEAQGAIVCPGFVNAHMHTWQTNLRGVAADWTLLEYFKWVHKGLATRYSPADIGISTLCGALGQLDVGTTTLGDWCHNNPTPAHTDAAVQALQASGIRAVFFHGSPKPEPKPGEKHFSEVPHPRREIARLAERLSGEDQLVTLGMAILGPHYSTIEVSRHDLKLAREFGLIASMHQGGGVGKTPGGWNTLIAEGLVGPNVNIVHGNDLGDAELERFVRLGASFSVTPENEMTQGHGFPITGRLRALGAAPSLGVDLESIVGSSMLSVARMALACQRALDNAEHRRDHGGIPATSTVPVRDALRWITSEGARALGLAERTGSLTPGKQADIVIVRPKRLGVAPMHDPYATLVLQCDSADIDSVMVAGRFLKREGRLSRGDVPELGSRLAASGHRILAELGLTREWSPPSSAHAL